MSYQDYPPPPNYGQWGPPPPQNSSNATVALVLGIAGLVICPIICSILAIVFAGKAYAEIDYSGGRVQGRGLAQAGKILGWVGLGLWGLGILLYVVLIVALIGAGATFDSNSDFDAISPPLQLL